MLASKICELGFRMVYAEKNEAKWFYDIEVVRKMYSCNTLSNCFHVEIQEYVNYTQSNLIFWLIAT